MKPLSQNIVGVDIKRWPMPLASALPEAMRRSFEQRCAALTALTVGISLRAAAKEYGVDRRTLANDQRRAQETGPDGKVLGFRACIPHRYRTGTTIVVGNAPIRKGANAFTRLMRALPDIAVRVHQYSGALPNGTRKCRAFDALFSALRKHVVEKLGQTSYPIETPDEGRRALLNYIKRARKQKLDASQADIDSPTPTIVRFSQIFTLQPLDRVEYDGHKIDVDWKVKIPDASGRLITKDITSVTLLALICVVSRYLLAHILILGDYNLLDVLQLIHRAMVPWHPRALVVPGMQYFPGSILGLPGNDQASRPRAIVIAGDNALAHHAHTTTDNVVNHHRGILNYGKAYVPEVRPNIEALFRLLEEGALRKVAGGFQPQTNLDEKRTPTSHLRAVDHPMHWEGLQDLMDVIAAGYNVTPHRALQNRTPASVLGDHLASSAIIWRPTSTPLDAARLTTIPVGLTVRGNHKTGKLPYVEFLGATYRSERLITRWDWIGKSFPGEINMEDLRHIIMLEPSDGTPLGRLSARPPWDQSCHSITLRRQILKMRARKLLNIEGSDDAVAAYHAFTREQALISGVGLAHHMRVDAGFKPSKPDHTTTEPRKPSVPRGGWISLKKAEGDV